MTKLRNWEIAALVALSISLCVGTWAQNRQSQLAGKLVRLHVIAASDEETEQEIKLRVRDAVLEYLNPVLSQAKTPEQARRMIENRLEVIAQAASSASEGRRVTVSLGKENYPLREYDGFRLPAGVYDSLKVTLGEGQGHNWWCVVFPPLCVSAARSDELIAAMGEDDYALITGQEGYILKFRLLEIWGELKRSVRGEV